MAFFWNFSLKTLLHFLFVAVLCNLTLIIRSQRFRSHIIYKLLLSDKLLRIKVELCHIGPKSVTKFFWWKFQKIVIVYCPLWEISVAAFLQQGPGFYGIFMRLLHCFQKHYSSRAFPQAFHPSVIIKAVCTSGKKVFDIRIIDMFFTLPEFLDIMKFSSI